MLIYILHSDKIYTFRLPKEVVGSYVLNDYDTEGHVRNLVSIKAIDNKWYFISNDDIVVNYNGKDVEQIQLIEYNFYGLRLFKKENIILYVYPGNETNYVVKNILPNSTITIGNENTCDIVSLNNNIAPKQLEISYTNGVWKYKNLNSSIPIYINMKNRIESNLNNFDSIFIMGLRVIVMSDKIIIISPPTAYHISSQKIIDENKRYNIGNMTVEENIKDFYNQDDYFSKSPIFRKKYSNYEITITSPDTKEKGGDFSFLSQIVPSALMSVTSLVSAYFSIQNYRSGESNKESFITNLIMCVVMLITGIAWPIIEMFISKFRRIINGRLRVFNYKKYLKRKRKELTTVINEEKNTLEFNNLSLVSCQDTIKHRNSYLFSKNLDSPSFLTIKLGIGRILSSIKFGYQKPDLIVEDDKLLNDIDKLISDFKYIDNAPFTVSLKKYKSIAFINSLSDYDDYLKSIVLQLITLHDYKSLKLVVFTDEFSNLNKIKNLNHCWSDDRSFRYFASNINEAENISSELIRIFNRYSNEQQTNEYSTHYLIITDCIGQYKNLKIISNILHSKDNKGFSVIMFGSKIVDIPTGCNAFIDYNSKEGSFFQSEMDENSIIKFTPELIDSSIDFDLCIDLISNIPIKIESESGGSLPDKLGFLEMYNVGKLEQLNIINRWKNSTIVNSLAAPVGIDSNGNIINLDLHEKYHGPHGLIAGMTGSGKSEFIVTYILSLAINYSPEEVQFVLIDYKGGGLAGAFENRKTGVKLPHLVGTITNLDKAEMNRTLVSINSELQRRQRKFNEVKEQLNTGSIDIYKYQSLVREGTLSENMSHLFIICDEFAELKAQQPDFMDELVSAARIGRSLGIHLILATQKPSGVVDDQIWSNSKFKVCCKVQTADDSNEMIRKPDAAYLKESGRFYLQVGYDEYFLLGQSGYSGVQYIPSETVVSKLNDSVSFVNNIGDIYKNVSQKENIKKGQPVQKLGEELNNILKYIVDVANENGYQYHQLWLNNVPKRLLYIDLVNKYKNYSVKPFEINPLIGEYDDPKNQSQNIVTLPITKGGNTIIIGSNGMGKTTLLSTIIYSTIINHNKKEVNFYIVDLGTENLRKFSKVPQVGDVIGINDTKQVEYLFYMIEAEISKRQKYYTTNGGDFMQDVKNANSIFPNIVVIIHGIEAFKESFSLLYDERIGPITRSCSKYGINFIITSTSTGGLSYAIESNFPQVLMLNMNDSSEYELYFSEKIIPSKNPGRGIVKIESGCVEFQTALSFDEDNEKSAIDFITQKLVEFMPEKALPIPTVPKHLQYSDIISKVTNLNNIPIGINIVTAQYEYMDFTKLINLISATNSQVIKKFINKLINLVSLCSNTKVIVLNAINEELINVSLEGVKVYSSNFKKVLPILFDNVEKFNKTTTVDSNFVIFILGYHKLNSHMNELKKEDENVRNLDDLILSVNNDNFKFVIYEDASHFKHIINGALSDMVDNLSGIWVGSDFDMQEVFDSNKTYEDVSLSNDSLVIIDDSIPKFVKYPTLK